MTITFEDDSAVIIYTFEKVLSYAREIHHYFLGNCIWWIASILALDEKLRYHIDNLAINSKETFREVSTIPRDIARDISIDTDRRIPEKSVDKYVSDPLRRTRKGRANPLPKSKRQLKKARQKEARRIEQQANTTIKLINIRQKIIDNLLLE